MVVAFIMLLWNSNLVWNIIHCHEIQLIMVLESMCRISVTLALTLCYIYIYIYARVCVQACKQITLLAPDLCHYLNFSCWRSFWHMGEMLLLHKISSFFFLFFFIYLYYIYDKNFLPKSGITFKPYQLFQLYYLNRTKAYFL